MCHLVFARGGTVLLPALAPGDYPVTVRIAGREDRFVVPSVPAGVEPLRIPTDLSIEVQTHD